MIKSIEIRYKKMNIEFYFDLFNLPLYSFYILKLM
jgi:hypothetical protein